MKLSEVSLNSVKQALRIDYCYDDNLIELSVMPAALSRLETLTNRTAEDMENYPELVHAFFMLCSDLYDGTDEHEKSIGCICTGLQLNKVY